MRTRLIFVLLVLSLSEPAFAQDSSGCEKFAWPVTREQGQFAESGKAVMASGATLDAIPGKAFVLNLTAEEKVAWILPPERSKKSAGSLGAIVTLPAPAKPGIYQITLSADAWVDVVQDGQYARAVGSSGRSDCQGLRKSLRLELRQLPITLQLSGSSSETMTIAIRPVE